MDPFVGEIRMFGGNFAPAGWAFCDGQLLAISQNDVLFALIGTTYGGDGQSTFALPDLRGRLPLHAGTNFSGTYVIGEMFGTETVTLLATQIPPHTHTQRANPGDGSLFTPAGNVPAASKAGLGQYDNSPNAVMNAGAIGLNGGSQPHDNLMPFQCVNFIISLFGIFPSQ